MVAKDIFPFATVTDGCKEANFMGCSHFIYVNELTSENMYLPMKMAKKGQFHFSFFKVDSQNPKFRLEYLNSVNQEGVCRAAPGFARVC